MALKFTIVVNRSVRGNKKVFHYTWHVGDKHPCNDPTLKVLHPHDYRAVFAMADGRELDYIKNRFSRIPMTDDRTVMWRRELSQFIWDNLFLDTNPACDL